MTITYLSVSHLVISDYYLPISTLVISDNYLSVWLSSTNSHQSVELSQKGR